MIPPSLLVHVPPSLPPSLPLPPCPQFTPISSPLHDESVLSLQSLTHSHHELHHFQAVAHYSYCDHCQQVQLLIMSIMMSVFCEIISKLQHSFSPLSCLMCQYIVWTLTHWHPSPGVCVQLCNVCAVMVLLLFVSCSTKCSQITALYKATVTASCQWNRLYPDITRAWRSSDKGTCMEYTCTLSIKDTHFTELCSFPSCYNGQHTGEYCHTSNNWAGVLYVYLCRMDGRRDCYMQFVIDLISRASQSRHTHSMSYSDAVNNILQVILDVIDMVSVICW